MTYSDVPDFMMELVANGSTSAFALQFQTLTATRTSEVLQAKWDEIDLDKGVWTLPSGRMKARREHRIPFSDAALCILAALHHLEANPYLFPGFRHSRPLSNMAVLQLMRGMGYGVNGNQGEHVPHGFRSSFRDWSVEISNFPRDVAEMALAHAIKNKVEAAYRRGDLIEKRRKMMQEWANYLFTSKRALQ
ncbi:MAG: site-specific integrase [Candidatus Thiodiazotropha taylori]|nr:site-specific integrase [Candidatus Thiodiazotropha taylori]